MEKTPIVLEPDRCPAVFHGLLADAPIFDSSCSSAARVYYIDKDGGYYLKSAAAGALAEEAAMTSLFHGLGLAAEVVHYLPAEQDWLLTRKMPGEDCLNPQYLDDPKRLSALQGEILRQLHELPLPPGIPNRTAQYIAAAREHHRTGQYDASHFPDNWGYRCAEEAIAVVERTAPLLKSDTLIHGDFCLPNVMLKNWQFSGLIDLGAAGAGDRHMDLFWGIWSLGFNLKTDAWQDRFLDAYGRDRIDMEILNSIGAFEVFA